MPNYASNAATARRMIKAAGRNVTLVALDFDATDPNRPWRGPADPRATPSRTLTVSFVQVPIASISALGLTKNTLDLAKKAALTGIISTPEKLDLFQELLDSKDGRRYKIAKVDVLEPGNVTILQFLVLTQ